MHLVAKTTMQLVLSKKSELRNLVVAWRTGPFGEHDVSTVAVADRALKATRETEGLAFAGVHQAALGEVGRQHLSQPST